MLWQQCAENEIRLGQKVRGIHEWPGFVGVIVGFDYTTKPHSILVSGKEGVYRKFNYVSSLIPHPYPFDVGDKVRCVRQCKFTGAVGEVESFQENGTYIVAFADIKVMVIFDHATDCERVEPIASVPSYSVDPEARPCPLKYSGVGSCTCGKCPNPKVPSYFIKHMYG